MVVGRSKAGREASRQCSFGLKWQNQFNQYLGRRHHDFLPVLSRFQQHGGPGNDGSSRVVQSLRCSVAPRCACAVRGCPAPVRCAWRQRTRKIMTLDCRPALAFLLGRRQRSASARSRPAGTPSARDAQCRFKDVGDPKDALCSFLAFSSL